MAVNKEKSWFVFDLAALDRAWSDYTVGELIEKITRFELLDEQLAEEARKFSKGTTQVRWLGCSYLGTYNSRKEAQAVQARLDSDLVATLSGLADKGAKDRSLWQFYASRGLLDRWFGTAPGEVDVDYALLGHLTYTGVRFLEQGFQGILYGPCQERKLLQRNLIGGNIMEVPPTEEIGYDPVFREALLSITEAYLRERITRTDIADGAWSLVQALQKSIGFAAEKGLATYITGDQELIVAPGFSFWDRQKRHRGKAPERAPGKKT